MKRVLCVWLPDWPRQRRSQPGRSQERGGGARRALDLTDREALEQLVPWCQSFSPTVGLEPSAAPESLLFDVTGLGPLFQGEERLLEHVVREFHRRGFEIRAALADTLGAAWALAHYGTFAEGHDDVGRHGILLPPGHGLAALHALPVESLRLPPDVVRVLRELGLTDVGVLASLPRASLVPRFGPELLARLDQAAGDVAEVVMAHRPPAEFAAAWTFEQPTDRAEWFEQALERQVERVAAELIERRRGAQQLECRVRGQTGQAICVSVGLFRPSAMPKHLKELLQLQFESRKLAEPVASIELAVTASAPLENRQQELFAGGSRHDQERWLALLVDRLSNRLGRAAVARVRLLPDAQPEFAWRYEPLIGGAGRGARERPRKQPGQLAPSPHWALRLPRWSRPLHLLPRPVPLAVVSVVPDGPPLAFHFSGEQRIVRFWGPERIQTGWWRGKTAHRDYYCVETGGGRWFWLFRQRTDGRWFLHGTFE